MSPESNFRILSVGTAYHIQYKYYKNADARAMDLGLPVGRILYVQHAFGIRQMRDCMRAYFADVEP